MICLPAGAQSGLARGSQAFTRTMDMLGWGSLREDPASAAKGREAALMQQQVQPPLLFEAPL